MKEFELISAIRHAANGLPANGFEGIGDDCAILEWGTEALVFTSDALIEGVHFLRTTTSPYALGHKTLAVNLSDVAAMGVKPVAVLLSLSLPTDVDERWVEAFMEGFIALAKEHHVALIGGDTTRSEQGIALSVTAIGRGACTSLKRRRDARIGDLIFVTAPLGASAAGLRNLTEGNSDTPTAAAHRTPIPEIEVGAWLGEREEVHAMMDLSDGIASDLRHIVNESRVGAEINLEQIPVATGATRDDAIAGGEDYKILFTADHRACESLCQAFEKRFNRPLYPIGRIITSGVRWLEKGAEVETPTPHFHHF